MRESPVWATTLGDHRFDDKIDDNSWDAGLANRAARRAFLAEARALAPASLNAADQVSLSLFVSYLEDGVAAEICDEETWAISTQANPVTIWNYLPEEHHLETVADGAHLVARYQAIPAWIDRNIANLARGAAEGRVANAETVRRIIALVDGQLAQPIAEWPLSAPAATPPTAWSAAEKDAFARDLRAAVSDGIAPAYGRYRAFLADTILPQARPDDRVGLSFLPDGDACYLARVRHHTTLSLTPAQIHERGLAEVARVDEEIRRLGTRLFQLEDLAAVQAHLRSNDPELYFRDENEVEQAAEDLLARAKATIPTWFGILPRADCVVRRVPDYEAPYTTIAYYREPHPDGTKPGEYFINVYQPTTRPRIEAEALAFHESIPGHHLQIAIAQELPELPTFRKHLESTAFVEGWALYAERLADEMGMYSSDLTRLGMLNYEAWRAVRLVVDTGLHARGWSRAQAIDYMMAHTALARNNIENEVDRYINEPAQALAYKLGQLEILRLRALAQSALGATFDIQAFHDVILGGGALTLPLLDARVAAWIAAQGVKPARTAQP